MWRLKSDEVGPDGRIDPLSELVEEGRCEKGKIRIEGDKYHYDYTAAHPVVTQWHVPDLLMRQSGPRLRLSFDLLQDLSLFKPNQRLVYDGQTEVPVENGRTVTLETYAQTGEGILPIHYLLDAEGRPQLVTCGFLSWALTGNHAGLRPTPSRRPLRPKAR
jgi:hypothetical protein